MELFSWQVFCVAVPAVIFAGVSKAGFGSGAAFASATILALVLEPGAALGVMLPLLMLIDAGSLPAYWRRWAWPEARVLLLGSLPGTLLGAWFYAGADPDAIRLLIGAISVGFVTWQLAQKVGLAGLTARRFGTVAGGLAGAGLGFTSFISHAGGPVAAVFLLGRGLDKTRYQATTVLVFWAVNLLKAGLYGAMGVFTLQTFAFDLALAPFALLGTWLGVRAHRAVPERAFFALTYVLLAVTGGKLILDAVT
ncbi:sulfite exporter TauE/SafE family protein [Salipiger mucosus]|uniref:Probable membrane transporter protein n=1 Tax=Salipiger mucosus DSM 16094 TaxID=1123237 RepID=S9QVT8_9RHOB|nr:sulfite exporter TauE/SafE family protein [Salipiger mucosus]EPX85511.1 INTEGRAL MEMBRANE PROTEIN (Rhomboid family) [Salipiger mucosus DSM 16094]